MAEVKSQKIVGSINFQFKKSRDGVAVDSFEISTDMAREDDDKNAVITETIGLILDPPKCGDETTGCGCPRITFNHEVQFANPTA